MISSTTLCPAKHVLFQNACSSGELNGEARTGVCVCSKHLESMFEIRYAWASVIRAVIWDERWSWSVASEVR